MGAFSVNESTSSEIGDLFRRAQGGDEHALAALFTLYRARLRKMIRLRIDRRLSGRVDASDVLQDAYLEIKKRSGEYFQDPSLPIFLWLRLMTGQKLAEIHRFHLGVKMRNAAQEISLHRGSLPQASSVSLAELLLGRLTSPTRAARRAEMQLRLQNVLNAMDPIEREILTLRHFEELTNGETAEVLGISKSAASNRYVRAVMQLKETLSSMPGFFDV
jgi:RNA polymerase sigma-70 factor, ECF subfamily